MRRESLPIKKELNPDNLSPAEEKAFELLKTKFDEMAVNMDDFLNIKDYGPERVQRDKERVERKKREIREAGTEPKRKARLLEMILADQIELSNWFEENTHTIIPSEYDDLFHGVDLALETIDEKGIRHLALGIDATFSTRKIREKLRKIKEHIADGTLTAMEYFHSDDYNSDFYGTMSNIPQVIVGASGRTIQELGELWMTGYGLRKSGQPSAGSRPLSPEAEQSQRKMRKDARGNLKDHRSQFLFLEEIKMQLTAFKKFAEQVAEQKKGTDKEEQARQVVDKIDSTLKLINSILEKKGIPDREDVFKNSEDLVFQALSEAVNDFDNL